MPSDADIKSLHPLEIKVLREFTDGRVFDTDVVETELKLKAGQANQAVSWLAGKGLIDEVGRETTVAYELTELGREYVEKGSPESRIIALLGEGGPRRMPEIASELGLEQRDVGSAYGLLAKEGVLTMDGEKRVAVADATGSPRLAAVEKVLHAGVEGQIAEASLTEIERAAIAGISRKRGAGTSAFRVVEKETVTYRLSTHGSATARLVAESGLTGEEVGALTPDLLRDGAWKTVSFRPYNINVPPARIPIGRRNPYCEYIDHVKDKLISMGFEEFDGPIVETEFWNSDALFMPQFHSARDIHDVYYVDDPSHATEIEEPFLSRVASTHEDGWETGSRGWGYRFDRDFTRRLILRSQGTVMSAKTLHRASVPGKYFGVLRCFRYDQVDATHLADFHQTEGIVLGESVNLRTLLGLLKMFAEEVAGATDVRYVPGYFPFTEPSIEVHIKHPVLGWFELGGAGIFRPEVSEPMGVTVPVIAWGLGIDRMAMMHLGIRDIRELFSSNIENVRMRRRS